jgi:hypothetical protein
LNDSEAPRYLTNPILYFLAYRTYVNYNMIGVPSQALLEENYQEVAVVRFNLKRRVAVEARKEGDQILKGLHHVGQDACIEVGVTELVEHLRVLDDALYYALAYYLIGCENLRFLLVEFYKAVEAIKNAFRSEVDFLSALRPHGVTRSAFRAFGRTCNDTRGAPLDIGRHAPMPGAPLFSVDLRNVLVEPRSREVLETATQFCRQVIDGYLAHLSLS